MTLKSDMLRALEEDGEDSNSLKDVTLVGSDGGRVSATKAVLAIRSPVFKRMFFGRFQEANSDSTEVNMDYSAVVLQVVVKYCYADELDLDLLVTEEADHMTDREAVAMVQVRDAANYLELHHLHKTLSNELGESILSADKGDLGCVCAILQELMARGGIDGLLWATCMDLVEANPEACLLPRGATGDNQGILACSLPLLGKLFESTKMDAFVSIMALKKWNEEHGSSIQEEDHKVELKKTADALKLETIDAKSLADIQPCGLFPMERLYKAFVHHGKSLTNRSPRALPVPMPTTATVRGAGVECANGKYTHTLTFGDTNSYRMEGLYGDMASTYILKKHDDGRWKISVEGIGFHVPILYEASSSSAGGKENPPFALWECVDGKDPTPYVSVQKSVPSAVPAFRTGGLCPVAASNNPLPNNDNVDQMADAFRAGVAVNNRNNNNVNDNQPRLRGLRRLRS